MNFNVYLGKLRKFALRRVRSRPLNKLRSESTRRAEGSKGLDRGAATHPYTFEVLRQWPLSSKKVDPCDRKPRQISAVASSSLTTVLCHLLVGWIQPRAIAPSNRAGTKLRLLISAGHDYCELDSHVVISSLCSSFMYTPNNQTLSISQ